MHRVAGMLIGIVGDVVFGLLGVAIFQDEDSTSAPAGDHEVLPPEDPHV